MGNSDKNGNMFIYIKLSKKSKIEKEDYKRVKSSQNE